MKRKIKIVNIVKRENDPSIFAEIIDLATGEVTNSDRIDRLLQHVEKYSNVFDCVNFGHDRMGLPCVTNT